MKADDQTLTLIRSSFPGRDRLIERAFRESASFRELCEDYRRCVAALHRWQPAGGNEAPPRWMEYQELLAELGSEILSWLDTSEAHLSRPSGNRS